MSRTHEELASPCRTDPCRLNLDMTSFNTSRAIEPTSCPEFHGSSQKSVLVPSPMDIYTDTLKIARASGRTLKCKPDQGLVESVF
jgi:hypothetical protein